ncbi:MAG: ferric reductase-like transmembrane domain-containing protein [bacterium]|nr:ferric reductase-like transmembrane domain-containing protein [bacterium]
MNSRKFFVKNLGPFLLILLSFLPLVWWSAIQPLRFRFADATAALVSLGQITGIVGMAMFSLVLVLSARFYIFDVYFGGLNRAYFFHYLFGGLSLVILMSHPLFLLARHLPYSLKGAADFLLPGAWWQKDFGIYSLALLMLLIIWSIFFRRRYHIWKLAHKFLGIAFLLGGIHGFAIGSDLAQNQTLKIYMITIASLGLCAFIYRTILGRLLTHHYEYEVTGLSILPQKTVVVELNPKKEIMEFNPGQFVFVSFLGGQISQEWHPFSIASGSSFKGIRLIIKELGDYTANLKNLKIGSRAKLEGPFGNFSYQSIANKKQVWIAGGIGVTPFLSMAESLTGRDQDLEIDFYYCTRNKDEQLFLERFNNLSAGNKNLTVRSFCSVDHGWLNAGYIKQNSRDLNQRDIFICGPLQMMKDLRKQFLSLNILNRRVHTEEFNF